MEPRSITRTEFKELIHFLDKNLRQDQQWSIADEYPLALYEKNLNNFRLIKHEGQIVASAVVKQLLTKTPVGIFNVAAIGSVVTAPDFRNLGHSHRLLKDCLELASSKGCDFAILWTDLFEFYNKIGFELAGTEVALHITKSVSKDVMPLRFVQSHQVSAEALGRLYTQHRSGALRTASEIERHLQIPNSRIYTAWDDQNRLQAYAVEGKGLDLQNYIHEWGGGVSKFLQLLDYIFEQRQGQSFTVMAPAHAQNLLRQLQEQGIESHYGYLGMFKLLNTANIIQKVKRQAIAMGVSQFLFEERDGTYFLGKPSEVIKISKDADLVKLLFGPGRPDWGEQPSKEFAETLDSIFPLPFWIWGWDSV
ncbi:MAG: GNAT family N-acetyltransferase [Bdellovibrionales bacterium]|nr:GNAT family N-acetyltransferase [Bdellovibrionales bacterium]